MSHSVRITQTTTTTSGSSVSCHTGYLKTVPGILKLLELIIGVVCVAILGHYYRRYNLLQTQADLFFFLIVCTFMICTFCLLISCLISWSTGGIISKTIFEFVYHLVATVLIIIASVTLLVKIQDYKNSDVHTIYITASVLGLINGVLYLASTVFAQRSYKGI